MDQTSYAVDQSTDRKHAAIVEQAEMSVRRRNVADADAVREIQAAGYVDTDWMIDKHLRCDQQFLVSQVLWAALQYGAADGDNCADETKRLLVAAQELAEAVIAGRSLSILSNRGLA